MRKREYRQEYSRIAHCFECIVSLVLCAMIAIMIFTGLVEKKGGKRNADNKERNPSKYDQLLYTACTSMKKKPEIKKSFVAHIV